MTSIGAVTGELIPFSSCDLCRGVKTATLWIGPEKVSPERRVWCFNRRVSSLWFQPIWKILVKFGSFPQVGVKIKNMWNHHLGGYVVSVLSKNYGVFLPLADGKTPRLMKSAARFFPHVNHGRTSSRSPEVLVNGETDQWLIKLTPNIYTPF